MALKRGAKIAGIKAVLFDFGGTLDADGRSWIQRLYSLYREAGIEVSQDSFKQACLAADEAMPKRYFLEGLPLEATVSLQAGLILEALKIRSGKARDEIAAAFVSQSREAFCRNLPILRRLSESRKLGIVSNFYGNLEGILKAEGLADFFTVIADSGVVGTRKPGRYIFLYALDALGENPDSALMVGDSLNSDMRGAEDLGMAHVWINPGVKSRCCSDGHSLRGVSELEGLLDGASQ